ncbi:MAG: DUF885 family protein [Gammaproteobacteria bacterium]|nr:DUF885 family protein [Gammaproteobacteria bacterium]MDE0366570.1 DUF885 family protein [Gammaproteobacteria bacterium]
MNNLKTTILPVLLLACCALTSPPIAAAGDSYDDLVDLFFEFREFQQARINGGIPDYSKAAMADQYRGLKVFQTELAAIDTTGWPVWQQVDHHLVRAEMNALEFHHREHRPWSRDPGFYSMFEGDAGASINAPDFFGPVYDLFGFSDDGPDPSDDADRPLSLAADQQKALRRTLEGIPGIYAQARENLSEPVADYAEFAVRNFIEERQLFEEAAEMLAAGYPDLADAARRAAASVEEYRQWIQANKADMAPNAGLGKDNYDWWMRNVQLSPWGWEETNQIIEREYDRIITFLKLEENRNRRLPPLKVSMSEKSWHESMREALHRVVDFLRDEELMTVDDWVNPADYYAHGGRGATGELDDSVADWLLPENSSIDTKVRQREILPGEAHEYIGHMLDYQRQERLTRSPIRSAGRRFNMGSMRLEGWAVALEELLMQAGVLDGRPRNGREMEYLMNASHMSLGIPDLKMHANEIDLTEARHLCAQIMPRGWSRPDERMVWFEMQSNLRNPGGFHSSNVVAGKAYFMKLFREQAQALGDDFVIRDFIDEFLSSGTIPMSLIRWEMTGNRDDVVLETEPL